MTRLALLIALVATMISPSVDAADYKASLSQMPVYAESQDKGVFVDLLKAISAISAISAVSNKSIVIRSCPLPVQ